METPIGRRDFLRTTSLAAGVAAHAFTNGGRAAGQPARPADVRIASHAYQPSGDYSIQPKRFSQVTLTDRYWKPRVLTNATVTIPMLVERMIGSGRGLNGNVLEAAILSLEARPDAQLQAMVDKRVAELRSQPRPGNSGFEVAATYFTSTGKRDLLDPAVTAAAAAGEVHRQGGVGRLRHAGSS